MKILLKYGTAGTKLLSEAPSHLFFLAGLMFTLALLPLGGRWCVYFQALIESLISDFCLFFSFLDACMNSKIHSGISNGGERQGLNGARLLFRLCSSMFNYLLCKYGPRIWVNMGNHGVFWNRLSLRLSGGTQAMKCFYRSMAENPFFSFWFLWGAGVSLQHSVN